MSYTPEQVAEFEKDWAFDCLQRTRAWDGRVFPTTDEYDEYFAYLDHARQVVPEGVSQVEEKFADFQDISDPFMTQDPYKNGYVDNPEEYCELMKRKLMRLMSGEEKTPTYQSQGYGWIQGELSKICNVPPELIHLHDAIFPAGEHIDNLDPVSGVPQVRHWWDQDVIEETFQGVPKPQDAVEHKVDWYLKQTEKQ